MITIVRIIMIITIVLIFVNMIIMNHTEKNIVRLLFQLLFLLMTVVVCSVISTLINTYEDRSYRSNSISILAQIQDISVFVIFVPRLSFLSHILLIMVVQVTGCCCHSLHYYNNHYRCHYSYHPCAHVLPSSVSTLLKFAITSPYFT